MFIKAPKYIKFQEEKMSKEELEKNINEAILSPIEDDLKKLCQRLASK